MPARRVRQRPSASATPFIIIMAGGTMAIAAWFTSGQSSSGRERPVPRWSMEMRSRLASTASIGPPMPPASATMKSTPPPPGPPCRNTSGSGAGVGLALLMITTDSSTVRVEAPPRASGTVTTPQRTGRAGIVRKLQGRSVNARVTGLAARIAAAAGVAESGSFPMHPPSARRRPFPGRRRVAAVRRSFRSGAVPGCCTFAGSQPAPRAKASPRRATRETCHFHY